MMDKRGWLVVGATGAVPHVVTALLRLGTFVPYPRMVDFAAFYFGARTIRMGVSPYVESVTLDHHRQVLGMAFPLANSSPTWLLSLAPLTALPFPTAAFAWLSLLVLTVCAATWLLASVAGASRWRDKAIIFALSLTFGPVVLNLTLGQCALFILLAALVIGRALRAGMRVPAADALLWSTVSLAKLFPVAWLGCLVVLRRWRLLSLSLVCLLILLALGVSLAPEASRDYWLRFLPSQGGLYSSQPSLDDQSLPAYVHRLTQAQSYQVPGLSAVDRHTVVWTPPWRIDAAGASAAGYLLAGLLAVGTVALVTQRAAVDAEGYFYLWTVCCLLAFPHAERYNQVLLLPAMAWLWQRRALGPVALAYFFIGVSRLTHLWVLILPWPWGPLSSGFGLHATLLLAAAMAATLLRGPAISPCQTSQAGTMDGGR